MYIYLYTSSLLFDWGKKTVGCACNANINQAQRFVLLFCWLADSMVFLLAFFRTFLFTLICYWSIKFVRCSNVTCLPQSNANKKQCLYLYALYINYPSSFSLFFVRCFFFSFPFELDWIFKLSEKKKCTGKNSYIEWFMGSRLWW